MPSHRLRPLIVGYVVLSVVLVVLILLATVGILRDIRQHSDFEHLVTDRLINALADTRLEAVQVQQYLTDSAATGEDDGQRDALKSLQHAQQLLREVSELDASLSNDAQTLSVQLDRLYQTGVQMVAAYRRSQAVGNDIMKAPDGFDQQTDKTVAQLEKLAQRIEALQQQAVAAQDQSINRAMVLVLVLAALLSAVSIVAGRILYRQIFAAIGAREHALSSLRSVLTGLMPAHDPTVAQGSDDVAYLSQTIITLVSEREASRIEMERAKEAAESSNRAKSQFLANLSHEVRTPLNGVLGMADLLEISKLDAEQKAWLADLKGSAHSLLDTLLRILDFAHIEAGRLNLSDEPFALKEMARNVMQKWTPAAALKKLELSCDVSEQLPAMVHGDAKRVAQILGDLLDNAIKFTATGKIHLSIQEPGVGTHHGPNTVVFEVQDTGPGIPASQQESLFEAFVQGDGSITRKSGGNGLGLALCRSLVQAMKGHMELHSTPGRGSNFRVLLALDPYNPAQT